ncbi:outer membrane lipoprotein carrier protein LolA [Salmonella enterica subsp. enterica serovar Virchow]|nr:outer membrane lipoprotein carrier protein LolA [Salmonella enterica subsp. enterica serovar Virchow]EFG8199794.1 outer membrane lipoprotein carrier protein LolA [Escherichia coli]EFG9152684.1 outer membrane lipoprotein carrier protein LolA [Escherichia coli]MIL09201.1 outer membrane lipoprotein carrier protein LolA [Salmonella enterica subsp. enterica serovar Enteritidis]
MIRTKSTTIRSLAAALALSAAALSAQPAAAQSATAQKIADHFSSVKSMTGDFVQFGPKGEQTGGKFYIQRPGKIVFNYEKPSAYKVVADGKSVVILNSKLNTSDLYPLSKTPLKLLLDQRIDLSSGQVTSVKEEADLTTIKLADKQMFGSSTITMKFDPSSYELREWTITDAKGGNTTVMIYDVKTGVNLDPKMFTIDYRKNFQVNQKDPSNR